MFQAGSGVDVYEHFRQAGLAVGLCRIKAIHMGEIEDLRPQKQPEQQTESKEQE